MMCSVYGCVRPMHYISAGLCTPHYNRKLRTGDVMAHKPLETWTPRVNGLTKRETQVVSGIALGKTNRCIAIELGISIKTVEKHRQSAMKTLNVHSIAELTHYALANGLVENLYGPRQNQRPKTKEANP